MVEPIYTTTTETIYDRLPDTYRDLDVDWVLKKYISSIADQAGAVEALLERFDTNTPDDVGPDKLTSDLADPALADPEWLDWIAQLVGAVFPPQAGTPKKRQILSSPATGYQSGTKESLLNVVRTYLKEPKTTNLTVVDQWHIEIDINDSEVDGTTYGELKATYPTYQALDDAFLTYADHGSGVFNLRRSILVVKPAGMVVDINVLP